MEYRSIFGKEKIRKAQDLKDLNAFEIERQLVVLLCIYIEVCVWYLTNTLAYLLKKVDTIILV